MFTLFEHLVKSLKPKSSFPMRLVCIVHPVPISIDSATPRLRYFYGQCEANLLIRQDCDDYRVLPYVLDGKRCGKYVNKMCRCIVYILRGYFNVDPQLT